MVPHGAAAGATQHQRDRPARNDPLGWRIFPDPVVPPWRPGSRTPGRPVARPPPRWPFPARSEDRWPNRREYRRSLITMTRHTPTALRISLFVAMVILVTAVVVVAIYSVTGSWVNGWFTLLVAAVMTVSAYPFVFRRNSQRPTQPTQNT